MRHALITIHLSDQTRDGAIAQADADERLEHQAQAKLRARPAEPGRVVTLARRVRAPGGTHKLTVAPTRRWWRVDSHVIPSVIHQPRRGRTGPHWLDTASDLTCKDSTRQHAVDDPRLS
ncbi:MAG: hypothetical protein K0S88_5198 [Actinomycetia bacterium]|nr:hypothetical protein [Actinomycetes bacterium]